MTFIALNEKDKLLIQSMGISEQEVCNQIKLFRKGAPYLRLTRSCTIGDGIKQLDDADVQALTAEYPRLVANRNPMKFVPASGAATRMFKSLNRLDQNHDAIDRNEMMRYIDAGEESWKDLAQFFDGIRKFAFYDDLDHALEKDGEHLASMVAESRFKPIIEYLLTDKGLNYAALPKGLLKFHSYPEGARTAFEEHWVESLGYVQNKDGVCRLHFTVLPEHKGPGAAEQVCW